MELSAFQLALSVSHHLNSERDCLSRPSDTHHEQRMMNSYSIVEPTAHILAYLA